MESEGTFLEGGAMRLIIAYIQPETLMDVKQALFNNGIVKMSVTNALGCAAESGFHEKYRGADVQIDLLKKVRLEVALREENVDKTIDIIISHARTGTADLSGDLGDGKIFILPILDCVRIRTGERGTVAVE